MGAMASTCQSAIALYNKPYTLTHFTNIADVLLATKIAFQFLHTHPNGYNAPTFHGKIR